MIFAKKGNSFFRSKKLVIFLVWNFLALFYLVQQYYITTVKELEFDVGSTLIWELAYFYTWGLLTIIIIFLASKYRWDREKIFKTLLLHFIFAVVIAFLHRFISMAVYLLLVKPEGMTEWPFYKIILGSFDAFIIYWMILGIIYSFDYYKQFREHQIKTIHLESQLNKAELQALKMQLHPHFLFNTLHAISSLMDTNVKAAQSMLVRLSEFLRYSLDNEAQQLIKLDKEIEFIKRYLEIEKIRFADRLTVKYEIDTELQDKEVPALILQPLVENAIKHGIAPHAQSSEIIIKAFKEEAFLCLQVCDNGAGISAEAEEHVGLINTRKRLEQIYNKMAIMDYFNKDGFCVSIKIPLFD